MNLRLTLYALRPTPYALYAVATTNPQHKIHLYWDRDDIHNFIPLSGEKRVGFHLVFKWSSNWSLTIDQSFLDVIFKHVEAFSLFKWGLHYVM